MRVFKVNTIIQGWWLLLLVGLLTSTAAAQGKAQQLTVGERVAIVKALKLKGIVGENNAGYLEFRGAPQAREVVKLQNKARKQQYKKIAQRLDVPLAQVQQQRARQLRQQSPAGTWIQQPDGAWVRKE